MSRSPFHSWKIFEAYLMNSRTTFLTDQGPVPERPISVNPELKFCLLFCISHSYALLRVTLCVFPY